MGNKTLAILGRRNVGKSTVFNRLVGSRKSIVSPVEGVTRDRIYSTFDWLQNNFDIIDTGGFLPKEKDIINKNIQNQARLALEEAYFIIFLIDGRSEITSSDRILADIVKKTEKASILVVNKIDSLSQEENIHESETRSDESIDIHTEKLFDKDSNEEEEDFDKALNMFSDY